MVSDWTTFILAVCLSVINVITLLFADDSMMVSPRSQSDLLMSPLYNVWNWSVNWDLSINPTKWNYIAIGRAPPLQLSFAIDSPDDFIQVANVVKNLGVLEDNSFSHSIHSIEATFAPLFYNTLVRSLFEYAMQTCLPNIVANADCLE